MDERLEKILADIVSIISTSSSLDEEFVELVLKRLEFTFGYILKESDSFGIAFAIQKTEEHIKNTCNVNSVPQGLKMKAVDMVCGEFLDSKNKTGQLDISTLDLNGGIKSIKEGDVQVNFDDMSDGMKFEKLLEGLIQEGDLLCYRKIRW